jgi:anaerobic magnesium-protoporphyrin IX monomethyl ester cyclase
MRLALVHPPWMPPTSPPCGIAYLKAFLNTGKTFDLNLNFHTTAVHMLNTGTLPVEADISGYVLEPEHLKEAIKLFTGKDFYNPEEYNRACSVFFNYFEKINSYIKEESMKYVFENRVSDDVISLFDRILKPVITYHPDVVGFSQMVLFQREFILGLADHLKQEEDIPLIIGGASIGFAAPCYISEVGYPPVDLSHLFDAVFYGEGELPLQAYINNEPLKTIPNVVYKDTDSTIKNDESGIEDIDRLPAPNFDDFPLDKYYSPHIVLPVLTSKGCYWRKCTFCIHYKSYYKYRARSIEKVIIDLKELQKRYNAHYFLFADEMIPPSRFKELSSSIKKEGINIRYYTEAKPEKNFNYELLKSMYESGARTLLWGVESGTQRILDIIDKGTTIPDIERILKASQTAGIWNMVFMIIGYPTQTEEEIKNDIQFLEKNSQCIDTLGISLFGLEVGSYIYDHPDEFGIEEIRENPDPFSTLCKYEISKGLSWEELRVVYKKYYNEYKKIYKVSPYFGKMRDHMVLFADHASENSLF